jgi:hypothetical protein
MTGSVRCDHRGFWRKHRGNENEAGIRIWSRVTPRGSLFARDVHEHDVSLTEMAFPSDLNGLTIGAA